MAGIANNRRISSPFRRSFDHRLSLSSLAYLHNHHHHHIRLSYHLFDSVSAGTCMFWIHSTSLCLSHCLVVWLRCCCPYSLVVSSFLFFCRHLVWFCGVPGVAATESLSFLFQGSRRLSAIISFISNFV